MFGFLGTFMTFAAGVAFVVGYAALILVVGWMAANQLALWTRRALVRVHVENTVATFLGHVARVIALAGVLIAALSAIGINTSSIVAVLGAAGLAIALALQNSLSNLASGLLLVAFRVFHVGDSIEITNVNGKVENIDLFHTILVTPDNVRIVIPNSILASGTIRNFSALSTRRLDVTVNASYGEQLEQTQKMLQELIAADSRILIEPLPSVTVSSLGEKGVVLGLQAWVNSPEFAAVRSDLQGAIARRMPAAVV